VRDQRGGGGGFKGGFDGLTVGGAEAARSSIWKLVNEPLEVC